MKHDPWSCVVLCVQRVRESPSHRTNPARHTPPRRAAAGCRSSSIFLGAPSTTSPSPISWSLLPATPPHRHRHWPSTATTTPHDAATPPHTPPLATYIPGAASKQWQCDWQLLHGVVLAHATKSVGCGHGGGGNGDASDGGGGNGDGGNPTAARAARAELHGRHTASRIVWCVQQRLCSRLSVVSPAVCTRMEAVPREHILPGPYM